MTESDEVNSYNGSSSCCSSRIPPLSDSEQRLSEPDAPNHSSEDFHRFNSDHVKVIPSLRTTIPSGYKYLQVQTLTKEMITLAVHVKCRVEDAYLCCCAYLGFDEERLFGLALRTPSEGIGGDRPRNEYFFWIQNTVVESRPFLALHLRVRIYVDKAYVIGCPTTLRHYYLQLRENLLDQWSGSNSVAEERCWELAALALHADENGNDLLSFRAERYFPLWVVNVHGLDFVRRNMPAVREDLKTCSSNDAVMEYCQLASRPPFPLNCHLYGLRRHKMDTFDNAVIGINPRGIETSDVGNDGERIPLRELQWSRIAKLSYDKRKVTITGVDGVSLSLYAQFEDKARYLLEFCKAFHQATLFINNQFVFRQNSSTSMNSPLFCNDDRCLDDAVYSRRSFNSHASSNSTSGVVSDKPGSEADKDCEWTDTCGIASDCSCEEIQPFTVEDLVGEMDKTLINAVAEVVSTQDEATSEESGSDSMGRPNTSSRSKEANLSKKIAETTNETTISASCDISAIRNAAYGEGIRNKDGVGNVDNKPEPILKKQSFSDNDAMPVIRAKVDSCNQKDYCEEVRKTELIVDVVLKQPPQYNETLGPFHTQNKLQVPYYRLHPNPNMKPRWITVAGVNPSEATVSCPLETSTHLTYSEPKLHYQMYTRSGSPLTSTPTTSYQLPLMGSSARPSPSYTPPIIRTGASGGLFQKRHGQRVPHVTAVRGISRVQSMPTHNSQYYVDDDELSVPSSNAAVSIKHSQSSPGTRLPVYTKQPPPYEHAILKQAHARCKQKGVVVCQAHPNSAEKDVAPQRHSCIIDQEEMTLNSRIRQYPMMRALWQEHQQGSCTQLKINANSSSATRLGVSSVSNPMLSSLNAVLDDSTIADSQLQRRSSCQELSSSVLVTTSPHFISTTYDTRPTSVYTTRPPASWTPIYHRELYVPDPSPPSCCYYSPYAAGRNQMRAGRAVRDNESWIMSNSVLDLPPPPPYPPPRCPPSPTAANNAQMVA
ncbi:CBR-FRM-7 protein [Loa loa]|uniref:CBR-FRM-7 protein n=1 Tax=Loa loa TaxID=7209 RepID=A0A1S0UJF6_LOALO|nr:CBR-FRM-7 protein [Loa loa]EJD75820.1 CBR-FRM-7 protein [Loa loa]